MNCTICGKKVGDEDVTDSICSGCLDALYGVDLVHICPQCGWAGRDAVDYKLTDPEEQEYAWRCPGCQQLISEYEEHETEER